MSYSYLPKRDQKVIEKDLFGEEPDKTVYFEEQVNLDQAETIKQRRLVYKSGIYVHIRPHDRPTGNFMSFEARDHHKKQYPEAWARFEATQQQDTGSPVDMLLNFGIGGAEVATIKSAGATTLEQLLELEGFELAKGIARQLISIRGQDNERITDGQHGGRREDPKQPESAQEVPTQRQHLSPHSEGAEHAFDPRQTWFSVELKA